MPCESIRFNYVLEDAILPHLSGLLHLLESVQMTLTISCNRRRTNCFKKKCDLRITHQFIIFANNYFSVLLLTGSFYHSLSKNYSVNYFKKAIPWEPTSIDCLNFFNSSIFPFFLFLYLAPLSEPQTPNSQL